MDIGIFTRAGTISPQEARRRMRKSAHTLLDVRTAPEYEEQRIDGAKLIPVDQLQRRAPAELPDKHAPVFVYCRSGGRAASAVQMLSGMGYTDAVSIGGIVNWPYETVKGVKEGQHVF